MPCRYHAQKKSWMDSDLFEEWLREQDQKFESEGRKITLIIDNCPAHPQIDNLKAINLVFLPPNTTSKIQPMDQGVVRSTKAHYRSGCVHKFIEAIDQNKPMPTITVLNAMVLLMQAWSTVSKETVRNCFRKGGIGCKEQQRMTLLRS